MSNQDRIQNWRAGREARARQAKLPITPESDFAEECRAAGKAGVAGEPVSARRLLDALLGLLSHAPEMPAGDRRVAYEALQQGQDKGIEALALPDDLADLSRRQLRSVIRLVEHDLRADVAIHEAGYVPAGLAELNERLLRGYARRVQLRQTEQARQARRRASELDIAYRVALPTAESRELIELREALMEIHSTQPGRHRGLAWSKMAAFVPLLTMQLHLIYQESRVAPLWMLVGPVVLLCIISSLYFLTGVHFIMGMDVATFSLLGATTWIMVRQVILRSSGTYVSSRSLLNLEAVSPLALAVVQVFLYIAIYGLVMTMLIVAGHSVDMITLPADWKGVVAYFISMGAGGAALGLLFGAAATRWPYFLRFSAVIERFLQLFASVFFVSEQLPEQYRSWVLWSPFAHGMQLLRSAYFTEYSSSDASPIYLATVLVLLLAAGLAAERVVRCEVQPM